LDGDKRSRQVREAEKLLVRGGNSEKQTHRKQQESL
jgi:hypothetical protein